MPNCTPIVIAANRNAAKSTTARQWLLDLTSEAIETYRKLHKGDLNPVSLKHFVRFLRDTGRMDWGETETVLRYLKQL